MSLRCISVLALFLAFACGPSSRDLPNTEITVGEGDRLEFDLEPKAGLVDLWLGCYPDAVFVVSTGGRLTISKPDQVVFANSAITLFTRTMEATAIRSR